MSIKSAGIAVTIGAIAWFLLLNIPKTNRLLNPDPETPVASAMVNLVFLITGCRVMPISIIAGAITVAAAMYLAYDRFSVLITIVAVAVALRCWRLIVLKKNPQIK